MGRNFGGCPQTNTALSPETRVREAGPAPAQTYSLRMNGLSHPPCAPAQSGCRRHDARSLGSKLRLQVGNLGCCAAAGHDYGCLMKRAREIEILFRRLRLYDQLGRSPEGLIRTIQRELKEPGLACYNPYWPKLNFGVAYFETGPIRARAENEPGPDCRNHFSTLVMQDREMDEDLPDPTEETALQALRRRYGYLAAWLLRLNRLPEPSRLNEPTRPVTESRIITPARQPHPPRPR